jgi:hypothetical protein
MVAFREMDGGAALIALATFAASETSPALFVIASCPETALGASFGVFVVSCAATVPPAMMSSPATVAISFRFVALRRV